MLKLIKCEFLKLKRKKFIPLIILAAFLFPIPLTYLMTTPSMMERYTDRADAFDGLFNMVLGYGIQFLLPCIIGVIAAILFFMERDNDTFKNLRTIPVTSTQMVLAKIIVLFIFGIVFCVASTIATILCGIGTLEVYGIGYKLFLAVETGIFITAGTLPLIVLVVFFSKTYVFSILLCVFYSVLNMSATALFDTLPKTMLWLLPTPLTTFWSAGDMAAHGIKMDLEQMTGLIPSTFQVVFILGIMAFFSFPFRSKPEPIRRFGHLRASGRRGFRFGRGRSRQLCRGRAETQPSLEFRYTLFVCLCDKARKTDIAVSAGFFCRGTSAFVLINI